MRLQEKQSKFTVMIGKLILYANFLGYELTFGDAYRSPDVPYGHPLSLHRSRLAVDFNIFKDSEYLTDGSGHNELHDYWDRLGGAERIKNDLNHYSLDHGGMR